MYTNKFGNTTPVDQIRFLDGIAESRAKAFRLTNDRC